MEVKLADQAGFCFGVKRAVDTVYDNLNKDKKIYTYGPIVHNEEVVRELEEKGVEVIESFTELQEIIKKGEAASVIIRAHGIPRKIAKMLEESNLECIDATCPFVKRIHNIADEESKKGSRVIIVGNPSHPEVEGIVGWCNNEAIVIENPEDVENFQLDLNEKITVVAQTTYNYNKFNNIVEKFKEKGYNVSVVNTICNATFERQKAAKELASQSDVMIVIGGKNSSNTLKLYEICKAECSETYFIQTLDDLHLELPKAVRLVGITAGASTPNKLIEEVQKYVRINF